MVVRCNEKKIEKELKKVLRFFFVFSRFLVFGCSSSHKTPSTTHISCLPGGEGLFSPFLCINYVEGVSRYATWKATNNITSLVVVVVSNQCSSLTY